MQISFKYVPKERALELENSSGKSKSRIHLFDYNGFPGEDRFAIAASIIKTAVGEIPQLNWLEKKFFVLYRAKDVAGNEILYRFNKNSLRKRLGVSSKDIEAATDQATGDIDQALFDVLLKRKMELTQKWYNVSKRPGVVVYHRPDTFEQSIISGLVEKNVSLPERFKRVVFATSFVHSIFVNDGSCPTPLEKLKKYKKGEILVIPYDYYGSRDRLCFEDCIKGTRSFTRNEDWSNMGDIKGENYKPFLEGPDSPLVFVPIDKKALAKIEKTGKISQKIVDKILTAT